MKKLYTFLTLSLLASGIAMGQHIEASVYGEKNIVGFQKGAEVGFVTNRNFKSTYFYQATQKVSFGENTRNYPFHGVNLQFPIKQCDGLIFSGSVRTGFVNNKYLIITPQVSTEFRIKGPLSMAVTAGYRAGQAAMGAKVLFKI